MPNWKKVIVSGSSAHLNHVTMSGNISGSSTSTSSFGSGFYRGNLEVIGNVSASSTATGSFGKLAGDGSTLTGILSVAALERGIVDVNTTSILDVTFITSDTDNDVILTV